MRERLDVAETNLINELLDADILDETSMAVSSQEGP